MNEVSIFSALLIGLLGSTHCLGMCSGLAVATAQTNIGATGIACYNLGRLITYGILGALAGFVGEQLLQVVPQLTKALRVLAGLLIIAMGLYIGRWWMGLTRLEQVGATLWRYVQPLTRRLLPVRHKHQIVLAGMVWGLLPCGLIYSTLAWAMAAASWQQSGLIMLAFGLGTVPAMFSVGMLHKVVIHYLRGKNFRRLAGVFVVMMGLWTLLWTLDLSLLHGNHHGAHQQDVSPQHESHQHHES